MPRAAKVVTKLVKMRASCETLAISRPTFWRRWHSVFTDPRGSGDVRHGVERKVYEDELAVAVEEGGGESARLAVIAYRGRVGRR